MIHEKPSFAKVKVFLTIHKQDRFYQIIDGYIQYIGGYTQHVKQIV